MLLNKAPNSPTDKTATDPKIKKRNTRFRSAIQSCKNYKRKLIPQWSASVDMRRGKAFNSQSDEDRIAVPLDWSLTKAKQASLFSQVPQIRIDHSPESVAAGPWLEAFEQRLNDTLRTGGIEAAMEECLPDCINAAGIGAILVSHESLTEDVEVPSIDLSTLPPQIGAMIMKTGTMPDGSPIPTEIVPRIIDHRYTINRISPSDLLWPINFTGADFDRAPWVGRSGRVSWAEGVQKFKLTEDDRETVLGDERSYQDRLTHDTDKDKSPDDDQVGFDEIFFKEHQFDPEAKSYDTLHRMVFVNGKDDPIIDEPWEGQKEDPQTGALIGALRFPLRFFTLTYITDEAIPPSDSAIGRPMVNEINKGRTQMILQRERSLPIRAFDINRVDPSIQQSLMMGRWQAMIPVQGDATRVITEVSRSTMPPENFTFDRIAKMDANEAWQIGSNQQGDGSGIETKAEANVVQSNFQTRVSQERGKVAKFVVSVAEVLGGLLCLFEPPESFGKDFDPTICRTLNYSILADSTVLLDSNQRLKRLVDFLNFSAKSGWVDVAPVLKEIASLSGLDPNVVIRPPEPKTPETPNISIRLTGVEDMMNPLALAMMINSGQAPSADQINKAKELIQVTVTPPQNPLPGTPPILPGPGAPNLVTEQLKGGVPGAPPSQQQQVPPDPGQTPPPPPAIGEAHKDWGISPRINHREEGAGGNQK